MHIIVISQRKYAMDILEKTRLLNVKPVHTSMDQNIKLLPNKGESLSDLGWYKRLVENLKSMCSDISFVDNVVCGS